MVTRFETRKTGALLAYLAYFPDRPQPREVLMEILWPEEDPEATRARLRQTLASLRRANLHPGSIPRVARRLGAAARPRATAQNVEESAGGR